MNRTPDCAKPTTVFKKSQLKQPSRTRVRNHDLRYVKPSNKQHTPAKIKWKPTFDSSTDKENVNTLNVEETATFGNDDSSDKKHQPEGP